MKELIQDHTEKISQNTQHSRYNGASCKSNWFRVQQWLVIKGTSIKLYASRHSYQQQMYLPVLPSFLPRSQLTALPWAHIQVLSAALAKQARHAQTIQRSTVDNHDH